MCFYFYDNESIGFQLKQNLINYNKLSFKKNIFNWTGIYSCYNYIH